MFDRITAAIGCTESSEVHEQNEETLGYYIVFTVGSRGSFYYYGKMNERPMYCTQM